MSKKEFDKAVRIESLLIDLYEGAFRDGEKGVKKRERVPFIQHKLHELGAAGQNSSLSLCAISLFGFGNLFIAPPLSHLRFLLHIQGLLSHLGGIGQGLRL